MKWGAERCFSLPTVAFVRRKDEKTVETAKLSSVPTLHKATDFASAKASRAAWKDLYFTMLVDLPAKDEKLLCGVICSRKFHKRAVVRNRARRVVKEAVRLLQGEMPNCRLVFIPRRRIMEVGMPEVREHLGKALPWVKRQLAEMERRKSESLSV